MKDELHEDRREVRRRAPHRDHERRGRVHDRGPDRRRGHGHHHLALRLHQAHVGHDVSQAAPRRARARAGRSCKDEDFIERLFIGSTHDYILVFTDDGRCFWLKVHEIPQAGRATKGKPIVNLINVTPDTQIKAMVPVREFNDDEFLLFCTKNGTVKKTRSVAVLERPRTTGIKAIKIEKGDELIDVQVTSGTNDIVLATKHGLSVRFHESDVREMGRDTTGVKGIELRAGRSRRRHGRDQARGDAARASPRRASASARTSTTTACRGAAGRESSRSTAPRRPATSSR